MRRRLWRLTDTDTREYSHADVHTYGLWGKMDAAALKTFLEENPKMREILRLAVEVEEADPNQKGQFGWEWHDVRAHPSSLMKLVVAGIVKVNYKSNRSTMYLLVDRPTVKKALAQGR